ncbi:uncharacterized protein LOC122306060 [Carya illinoinensis]|uniref:Embryo sac development arrest 6 n=1 Tax=Carya illinoinensis TaxID=32201 RepID=A0A8T1QY13_CARIL|nr:uncharacterized protein LOC122306060 [Carya illinoinensis]KAG6658822.1 hypothetical protein CIPAW_04G188700 [Carya illinoinensis]
MSTKTMRLPPRRVLTPKVIDKKRKEREGLGLGALEPSSKPSRSKPAGCVDDPIPSNRLLAGYLAHEFLTRGTLLGLPWDPAKKEAVPVSGRGKQRDDGEAEPSGGAERRRGRRQVEDHQRYVELANLLKTSGAHMPGIVNPTQLACFLQLQL